MMAEHDSRRALGRWALRRDLMGHFRGGPLRIVAGDLRSQLKREGVELKRRLGLRLTAEDFAKVYDALRGIDASRRYVRGYGFIYEQLKARMSAAALARFGNQTIFPPTEGLVQLTKDFDARRIARTMAFLELVIRTPEAYAGARDLRAEWERVMAEDGPGEYTHFTRCAWKLIYGVAFKMPRVFLRKAFLGTPRVESYILATAKPGSSYYDVLAGAPEFIRVVVYVADANVKGHALDGAHIPFRVEASEHASSALDGYLRAVLGDAAARQHVLFSENRERVEHEAPLDVQSVMDSAVRSGEGAPR